MNDTMTMWLDESYDSTAGSDPAGRSRYGVYLGLNRYLFRADTGFYDPEEVHQGIISDPAQFAVAAWTVATGPVMSPPFLATHPRVVSAALRGTVDTDSRDVLATVTLAAPLPRVALSGIPLTTPLWSGWTTPWGQDRYRVPGDDRPAMLGMLELRIPVGRDLLPRPVGPVIDGVPDVEDAKTVLRVLVREIRHYADPVLAALEANEPGRHGDRAR